ncbi:ABC transporter substrate-binding protein [Marimonas arenosa]|uniref:ABC transporter substrate-binding protein n=1 Tax=Marimonas arenosa TaxID=1795305 RepID=A0AAE3WB37_9RHOB|nr:ABC transporter substrate-binding protein [Marimonas arenosa]MDQ2089711.1 ABC transporter substrate-binding protein [Marimonas arenosa]
MPKRLIKAALFLCVGLLAGAARADLFLTITFLHQEVPLPPVLSNLDPIPDTLGEDGARLGLGDNRTTGAFLGHNYALQTASVPPGGDLIAAAKSALTASPYLVLNAPAADVLRITDLPEAASALIFNVAAPDTRLRDADCRTNLFHTLPSEAMRADALMQALQRKRFVRLALITGPHAPDKAFAHALRRSAVKFGLKIVGEKEWDFDADMRRNASQEVPLFTQDFKDHDVLLVADEIHDFGRYIAYNTWLPRPVAGSEGLVPVAWSRVVEQWGAAQLQSRFKELTGRDMRPRDYAAWAAVRALGEAVTRTESNDPTRLRAFILSDQFELAGFKGRPQSFRPWNGQMRQPIPLVTDRAVVIQAPVEGFLHQRTELDTLGLDEPESRCEAFQ